jgi:hypothetical protein
MRRLTRAFHMAEAANWPPIQRDGLHSASALLERAGLVGEERARLERYQRVTHTVLPNGVQIRDQGPMPPAALARCLIGMSPSEWYALINAHVFFWLDPARLNRQRAACTARPPVGAHLHPTVGGRARAESILHPRHQAGRQPQRRPRVFPSAAAA